MTYVIAGGGTGGHVFPAIAVADALKAQEPNAPILFIGTERGLEMSAVPKAGYKLECVVISGLKGRSLTNKLRALFQLPLAVWACMRILRRVKAKAVLGVGGFASGPAVLAAVLLRIPVGLCEPNSVPGLTNRVIGRFAKKIFTAFKSTSRFFDAKKIALVGNAVRQKLIIAPAQPKKEGEPRHILVIGGSQGARALNQKLPAAFHELQKKGLPITVWHQTGKADLDETRSNYEALGLKARVDPFIDDMGAAYQWAEFVVCRSGATTCSELLASGPPAIFVPLPSAIYDHQMLNARELADEGAALVVPQDQVQPDTFATLLYDLLRDEKRRSAMQASARHLAKVNAASDIAHDFAQRFAT